jgi:hypothetical protein
MSVLRKQILAQLEQVESLLKQTTKGGEKFEDNLADYDDWAADLNMVLGELYDKTMAYVD